MQYPNLFKRIVPFVLALVLGLFVTSLFFSITPTFDFKRSEPRKPRGCREDYRRLRLENEELKRRLAEKEISPNLPNVKDAKDAELHYLDLLDRPADRSPRSKADKDREKEIKKRLERLERIK